MNFKNLRSKRRQIQRAMQIDKRMMIFLKKKSRVKKKDVDLLSKEKQSRKKALKRRRKVWR